MRLFLFGKNGYTLVDRIKCWKDIKKLWRRNETTSGCPHLLDSRYSGTTIFYCEVFMLTIAECTHCKEKVEFNAVVYFNTGKRGKIVMAKIICPNCGKEFEWVDF